MALQTLQHLMHNLHVTVVKAPARTPNQPQKMALMHTKETPNDTGKLFPGSMQNICKCILSSQRLQRSLCKQQATVLYVQKHSPCLSLQQHRSSLSCAKFRLIGLHGYAVRAMSEGGNAAQAGCPGFAFIELAYLFRALV